MMKILTFEKVLFLFSVKFALRIEVEILLVAELDSTEPVERVEAKKD